MPTFHLDAPTPKAKLRSANQRTESVALRPPASRKGYTALFAADPLATLAELGTTVAWLERRGALDTRLDRIIRHKYQIPHNEIKGTYFAQAVKNIEGAVRRAPTLF